MHDLNLTSEQCKYECTLFFNQTQLVVQVSLGEKRILKKAYAVNASNLLRIAIIGIILALEHIPENSSVCIKSKNNYIKYQIENNIRRLVQKQALNPLNKECRKNNKSNMELWLMFIKLNATRPIQLVEDKKAQEIVKGIPWTTLNWKYDVYNIKRGHIIEKSVGQQEGSEPDSQN